MLNNLNPEVESTSWSILGKEGSGPSNKLYSNLKNHCTFSTSSLTMPSNPAFDSHSGKSISITCPTLSSFSTSSLTMPSFSCLKVLSLSTSRAHIWFDVKVVHGYIRWDPYHIFLERRQICIYSFSTSPPSALSGFLHLCSYWVVNPTFPG